MGAGEERVKRGGGKPEQKAHRESGQAWRHLRTKFVEKSFISLKRLKKGKQA